MAWSGRAIGSTTSTTWWSGPPGVFVIDTKLWTGRVTLEDGVLWQDERDNSAAVWGVASAARSLSGLVSSVRPDHVHAVVCLAEGDIAVGWVDGVMVCTSAQLVDELTAYPEVLPGGLARAVGKDVDRRLRPVEGSESVRKPAPKRRPFAALVLGVLALAFGLSLLAQPEAITTLADDVLDWASNLGQ